MYSVRVCVWGGGGGLQAKMVSTEFQGQNTVVSDSTFGM